MESDHEVIDLEQSEEEDLEEEIEEQLNPSEVTDLLFIVQNLGQTKTVGIVETYVKSDLCIDLMKELYRLIRNENQDTTLKRLELGEWNILQSDLIKLLISYPEDRQTAFYCLILMVTLTEMPKKEHVKYSIYISQLQKYKLSFITHPDSIKILVQHLADCITKDPTLRNEQHDQMLELIVFLFRNLLAIPDQRAVTLKNQQKFVVYEVRSDGYQDLQRRFLHILADETVLEAFVYLCHDFSSPSIRKLNLCFLEIFHHIFEFIDPESFWKEQKENLSPLKKNNVTVTRHSKFGGFYKTTGMIGHSNIIQSRPNQQQPNRPPKQMLPVRPAMHKNSQSILQKPQSFDRVLLEKLRRFTDEVIESAFCPLIECVFTEVQKDSDKLHDDDKMYFLLLQTYILKFSRLSQKGKDIDISCITESLKIQNFELIYRIFIYELRKSAKKEFDTKLYHAAIKCCFEFLSVIKQMTLSASETTRRNSQILLQNVFYHDMARICRKSFDYWKIGLNSIDFLEEIVEFTDLVFTLLEQFSKGKALTIRTDKVSKEQHSDDETAYQERQLNFLIELSSIADYDVAKRHAILLCKSVRVKDALLRYFTRIVDQCQAEWIFFQIDFLSIFEEFLNQSKFRSDFQDLRNIIKKILAKFFDLTKENPLMFVECLFRFKNRAIKNSILSNYEYDLPDMRQIQTLDLQEFVEDEEQYVKNKSTWTRIEDLNLINHFIQCKIGEDPAEVMQQYFPARSIKQIKSRLKLLQPELGQERAMKNLEDLHWCEKQYTIKETAPSVFNQFSRDQIIEKISDIVNDYQQFCQYTELSEFALVPLTKQDFEYYHDKSFQNLLQALGFRNPVDGEWCWRYNLGLDHIIEQLEQLKLADTTLEEEADEEAEYSSNWLSLGL